MPKSRHCALQSSSFNNKFGAYDVWSDFLLLALILSPFRNKTEMVPAIGTRKHSPFGRSGNFSCPESGTLRSSIAIHHTNVKNPALRTHTRRSNHSCSCSHIVFSSMRKKAHGFFLFSFSVRHNCFLKVVFCLRKLSWAYVDNTFSLIFFSCVGFLSRFSSPFTSCLPSFAS